MKICITSKGEDLDAEVDPRFGRCSYFVFVDTDSLAFEAVKNPNLDAAGGAGIQSGQLVAGKGVSTVLTGNVGPNAFDTLKAAGVDVVTGMSGTLRQAITTYKQGKINPTQGPSVGSKYGLPGK